MPFTKEKQRTPTSIGLINIMLTDNDGIAANHIVTFAVQVRDQDGEEITVRHGNLIQHLTVVQKTMLTNFLVDMRTKAKSEVLP